MCAVLESKQNFYQQSHQVVPCLSSFSNLSSVHFFNVCFEMWMSVVLQFSVHVVSALIGGLDTTYADDVKLEGRLPNLLQ